MITLSSALYIQKCVNLELSNMLKLFLLSPILALPPVAKVGWLEPLAKRLRLDLVLFISILNFFFIRIGDLDAHGGFSCTLII